MYIRVKRERSTYFLEVEASDTVNKVKELLQGLVDGARGVDSMALLKDGSTLDGFKTLVDSRIENDAVLCLVLKKKGEKVCTFFVFFLASCFFSSTMATSIMSYVIKQTNHGYADGSFEAPHIVPFDDEEEDEEEQEHQPPDEGQ